MLMATTKGVRHERDRETVRAVQAGEAGCRLLPAGEDVSVCGSSAFPNVLVYRLSQGIGEITLQASPTGRARGHEVVRSLQAQQADNGLRAQSRTSRRVAELLPGVSQIVSTVCWQTSGEDARHHGGEGNAEATAEAGRSICRACGVFRRSHPKGLRSVRREGGSGASHGLLPALSGDMALPGLSFAGAQRSSDRAACSQKTGQLRRARHAATTTQEVTP